MLSACGLASLIRWPARLRNVLGVLLAFLLLSFIPPLMTLWQRSNDLEEQEMLEAVTEALPSHPVALARLTYDDKPNVWGVFLDYPDWLHRPPHREDRLFNLTRWRAAYASRELPCESYVYLGVRCYMRMKDSPASERTPDYEHPACRQVRRDYRLESVLERQVENHRLEDDHIWYTEREHLTLGLYRVLGENDASGQP